MAKSFEMDMTKGPLLKKMILYALPIVGINVIQLLFNAADVAVLGVFASDNAVAAVGATSTIVNLFLGFFIGLSLSANVLVARSMGANDPDGVKKFIGTSILLSVIAGFILLAIGVSLAKAMLMLINCPPAIIDMATTYLRIYFLGMPIIMLYNFSAAIMRAVGDTIRPFIFLVIGGVLNVLLNIFFIIVLKKDVEGVAIATVASQGVAAFLSIMVLVKGTGYAKIEKKYLKLFKKELKEILHIGIPTGLQRSMFSLSNLVVSSAINSFGEVLVAGKTIGHQFEIIAHDAADAFCMATLSFIGQNLGAKNFKRMWKVILVGTLLAGGVGIIVGYTILLLGAPLSSLMTDSEEVIKYSCQYLKIMCGTVFITGIMNSFANVLRGIGKPMTAMVGSLICTCGFRVLWVYTVFKAVGTVEVLYSVYPVSWTLCAITFASIAIPALKKLQKKHEENLVNKVDTEKVSIE